MRGAGGVLDGFGDGGNNRVLIVDDEREIHGDFREMLMPGAAASSDDLAEAFRPPRRALLPEFALLHADGGERGCRVVEEGRERGLPVAVAYVDVRMPPGIDGLETIRRMRRVDRDVEIVIMTAYADKSLSEIVDDVDLLHKLLYIRKPFAREEIQQITLSLVAKWNVERALASDRRRLARSHRRLEAVLDATGDAIAMYDGDARLVFANRWYTDVMGVPTDELRGLSLDDAKARFTERSRGPGADDRRFGEGGSVVEPAAARAGGGPSGEPGPRGSRTLFYRRAHPVRDGGDAVIGELVVYRDISREIEIEWMKREVERLRSEVETTYSFDGIVGSSPAMRDVCALMKQAVASDLSVLVRGESGTGKELVAKAIHFNGPRRRRPFLAVNCAAVPETLIESELFGHERGAFTGASARKVGLFEQASGGTLLLDEIGDMPPALQAKLLRVLQEREIRRVGGAADIPVDVRVIAATHQDLEAAMRAGAFRSDLFYRLAVFPIVIPPLRARPDDVKLLADHFLEKHAARLGRPVRGISEAAYRRLARYDWPGNVRELENALCRALVLETTDLLRAAHLPGDGPPAPAGGELSAAAGVVPLADLERQAIARAIELADRNLTRAARTLGINRTTLHRKLKRYSGDERSALPEVPQRG